MEYKDTIETNRLLLRRFYIEDAEDMFKNWASDPEVTKYLTWNPHKSVEETKAIINMWLDKYNDDKTFRFAIVLKDTNELMGSIDVVKYIDGNPEIGCCLSKKHWNKGYMTEAVNALITLIKNEGFKKIIMGADERNIGSNRVIEKCGFKFTYKELREHCSQFKLESVIINWYELNLENE